MNTLSCQFALRITTLPSRSLDTFLRGVAAVLPPRCWEHVSKLWIIRFHLHVYSIPILHVVIHLLATLLKKKHYMHVSFANHLNARVCAILRVCGIEIIFYSLICCAWKILGACKSTKSEVHGTNVPRTTPTLTSPKLKDCKNHGCMTTVHFDFQLQQ